MKILIVIISLIPAIYIALWIPKLGETVAKILFLLVSKVFIYKISKYENNKYHKSNNAYDTNWFKGWQQRVNVQKMKKTYNETIYKREDTDCEHDSFDKFNNLAPSITMTIARHIRDIISRLRKHVNHKQTEPLSSFGILLDK